MQVGNVFIARCIYIHKLIKGKLGDIFVTFARLSEGIASVTFLGTGILIFLPV